MDDEAFASLAGSTASESPTREIALETPPPLDRHDGGIGQELYASFPTRMYHLDFDARSFGSRLPGAWCSSPSFFRRLLEGLHKVLVSDLAHGLAKSAHDGLDLLLGEDLFELDVIPLPSHRCPPCSREAGHQAVLPSSPRLTADPRGFQRGRAPVPKDGMTSSNPFAYPA